MTYFFETYGCQMNKAESASIEQLFIDRGWTQAENAETADFIVINTCSVRATAETRIHGRLGWFSALRKDRAVLAAKLAERAKLESASEAAKLAERAKLESASEAAKLAERAKLESASEAAKLAERAKLETASEAEKLAARAKLETASPCDFEPIIVKNVTSGIAVGPNPFILAVTGCMAERLKDDIKKQFPVVDYVVGTFQKQHFMDIIDATEKHSKVKKIDEEPTYSFAPLSYEKGAFQAYVPIMHGCNNFCSYCIVPYVRGREVSRNPEEILKELDQLSHHKVREITLLGQNVNSYKWSGAGNSTVLDFPGLMKLIANHLKETNSTIGWVRFMSSHPKDISETLIDVMAEERVICRHIHLPVQHGSTKVLADMNRKYTREDYLQKVDMIKNKLPDASLSTDILIGFPGESEEEFEETVSLLEKVGYEDAFLYYYNPREGTKACSMPDQIPMEIKKKRLAKIIDIQNDIKRREMKKREGKVVKVLVECVSKANEKELLGRTEQDAHVVFEAPKELIGTFVDVKLDELTGNTFRGTLKNA